MVDVAGAFVGFVGVLEVEVEPARPDLVDADAPGLFVLDAVGPPGLLGFEFLDADGFAFVVAFGARRVGVLVVPDFGGGGSLGEEEEVGPDAGIGVEDAVGEADDGVEVALGEEGFLDAGLDPLAEEGAVGQDESGAAAGLEELHDEDEEEVGGFAGAELGGEVGLDAVFFHAAEGGIGDDAVDAFLRTPVAEGAAEGVVMADAGGDVDAMEEEVGHAEDVREVLLLDAGEALLDGALVLVGLGLFAEVFDDASEEAACPAGGVEDGLAEARVDLIDDELGDGPRGVEFPGIPCGLEVLEDLLVDVAEHVAVVGGIEVDAVDAVDDLPHEGAVLHVVVGILEGGPDDRGELVVSAAEDFQLGEEVVVDEGEEGVAGDPFLVGGPGGPAEGLRDGGLVAVAEEFELLLPVVEDLEEEHPAELLKALGVAVGAGVLAHDVLDGFDDVGDVGHGEGGLGGLVKGGFEFLQGGEVAGLPSEVADDLDGCAEGRERIDFQDLKGLDTGDAGEGVFLK